MTEIILPVVLLTATGGGLGLILGLVAKFMAVQGNELAEAIRADLPGVNCGACGYAGCDEYAEKLAHGAEESANLCTPGGRGVADALEGLLGKDTGDFVAKIATVNCVGTCDKTSTKAEYRGEPSCKASVTYFNGSGQCAYGCLGFADCVKVCLYDAIYMENGVPVVDRERCTGCGMCKNTCPKQLIEINVSSNYVNVSCSSNDKGPIVRKACSAGCIGCSLCVKQCEFDAIKVENFLAKIDPQKCTNCQKCVEVCPTKVIRVGAEISS